MEFILASAFKLLLSCVLGGIIGYEREHTNRPAGFRTHILVCVGSALVMVTSEYIFNKYSGITNLDPARLGAQVISGIGFLGAGTIIREGFNVKGLTTAASLWAVSCVGIAAGSGFYEGAVIATGIIFITLIVLKRFEASIVKKNKYRIVYVQAKNRPDIFNRLTFLLSECHADIKSVEFVNGEHDEIRIIRIVLKLEDRSGYFHLSECLYGLEGVQKVYEE